MYGEFEGLTQLVELELDNESWSFYLLGVWRDDATGAYFLGTDSGCSCPTPWEFYQRGDLTGPLTAEQAREEMDSLVADGGDPDADEVRAAREAIQ